MQKKCWVITDGSAGMENQALGLGEAMGYNCSIKRIKLKKPWLYVAPYLRIFKKYCMSQQADILTKPWPDLVIACGRRSILPALYVKEQGYNSTKLIYLQDPKISTKHFDIVICPSHDNLQGDNVINMVGAPHRVTEQNLNTGIKDFKDEFSKYKKPKIGVLLGGPNRVYQLDHNTAQDILVKLLELEKQGYSLIISPSRRTPKPIVEFFKKSFADNKNIYFWDKVGKNPYFGILALTDILMLTCDSVSMASEAISTDKPVYLLPLPGGSKKFEAFQQSIIKMRRARWYKGKIEQFKIDPFDETEDIAKKSVMMFQKHKEK